MSIRARGTLAVTAALLGWCGLACSDPKPEPEPGLVPPGTKVHTQPERTMSCEGQELRIPALDESMTLAWASFQVAQRNQESLAALGAEARKALFDACILPAIVGTK